LFKQYDPTFGLKAEGWMVELLRKAGFQVLKGSLVEDRIYKIDFWVTWKNGWLAIQFTIDKKEIISGKGLDALKKGICPSWVDAQELEEAAYGQSEYQKKVVEQFWRQVDGIVAAYPELLVRRAAAEALHSSNGQQLAGVR